jgi:hypothetical protein
MTPDVLRLVTSQARYQRSTQRRELLERRLVKGEPIAQAGAALGLPNATAKWMLKQTLDGFRRQLGLNGTA